MNDLEKSFDDVALRLARETLARERPQEIPLLEIAARVFSS